MTQHKKQVNITPIDISVLWNNQKYFVKGQSLDGIQARGS